jgi:hypothetical protein
VVPAAMLAVVVAMAAVAVLVTAVG